MIEIQEERKTEKSGKKENRKTGRHNNRKKEDRKTGR